MHSTDPLATNSTPPSPDGGRPLSADSAAVGSASDLTRRQFLGAGMAAGVVGALGATGCAVSQPAAGSALGHRGHANTAANLEDNIYTRLLGVRPHIGAHEHITTMGGIPDASRGPRSDGRSQRVLRGYARVDRSRRCPSRGVDGCRGCHRYLRRIRVTAARLGGLPHRVRHGPDRADRHGFGSAWWGAVVHPLGTRVV